MGAEAEWPLTMFTSGIGGALDAVVEPDHLEGVAVNNS